MRWPRLASVPDTYCYVRVVRFCTVGSEGYPRVWFPLRWVPVGSLRGTGPRVSLGRSSVMEECPK